MKKSKKKQNNNNNNNNNNKKKKKKKKKKKNEKYRDRARELKKPENIKVTVIPMVIGAIGTVTKRLIQGLKD